MVECHHKTADTVVIGLSVDAATEDLRLSRLQSIMVTSKRKGTHSSEAQVAALDTAYGGNSCHISIFTWPCAKICPTSPPFTSCGFSFGPLSSNCFMESA